MKRDSLVYLEDILDALHCCPNAAGPIILDSSENEYENIETIKRFEAIKPMLRDKFGAERIDVFGSYPKGRRDYAHI